MPELEKQKEALELEKLRLEVEELKKSRTIDRWLKLLPLFTVVGTFAGIYITLNKYNQDAAAAVNRQTAEQAQATLTRSEEKRKESEVSRRDFLKPLLTKQMELYVEASNAASTYACTSDAARKKEAEQTFWRLYFGPMTVFESQNVDNAMVEFGKGIRNKSSDSELENLSLALARTLSQSMLHNYRTSPEEFNLGQTDYTLRPTTFDWTDETP